MSASVGRPNGLADTFLSHLVAVLSIYELGPFPAPVPRYDGPQDWQTESIMRSLSAMARRMYTAEEALKALKASESWQSENGTTKRRRSVDNPPPDQAMDDTSPSFNRKTSATDSSDTFTNGSNGSSSNGRSSSTPESIITDCGMDDAECDERTPSRTTHGTGRDPSPMAISLDGLRNNIDPAKMFARGLAHNGMPVSAPPTSHADHVMCPTCGKAITDAFTMSRFSFSGSPSGSPLVVPPGPLAAAAFESGLSAVEELRLLKTQVQDVARVCEAVARGDLSQKITVPVQGVVMVQLKDVINTMVRV